MAAQRQGEDTDEKRALGEALQRAKLATHARVTSNGEQSIVALPGGKNRRAASVALLERIGWDRVELVDKSGAVVDVVGVVDDAPADVELVESEDPTDRRVVAIVSMIERATDAALARRESEFKALLAGVTSIIGAQSHAMASVTQAMDALTTAYRESGDAREQSARQLAEAAAGDGDPLKAITELAPHIPALVAMARSFGIGAAPTTGVKP